MSRAEKVRAGHYFGDYWQLTVGWALDPNPYRLDPLCFHGLPPMLWAVRLVDGWPRGPGRWFASLSLALTLAASWLLMRRPNRPVEAQLPCLEIVTSVEC